MKKMKITKAQLLHIIEMANDMEAMLGNGEVEPDRIWKNHIRAVDRMLKSNGLKRALIKASVRNDG